MEYHIEVKSGKGKGSWKRIASFDNCIDRDDCMAFLQDRYEDCEFRSKDEIE